MLYKPDSSEFVDAETQLNRNWDIVDSAVKRLLEYEYNPLSVPDVTEALSRSRFYKPYSNSISTFFRATPSNFFWQDPVAFVAKWNLIPGFLIEGMFEHQDIPIFYRIIKKTGGTTAEVEWGGAFWELGGPMELNTTTQVMAGGAIPTEARPTTSKYFTMSAGNTSGDFSISRILVGADGHMEFKRYGVNPSGSSSVENRVELTGIRYNVEVTGS